MRAGAIVCVLCACGRIGFEQIEPADATTGTPAAWMGTFVANGHNTNSTADTFTAAATTAGDAIVLHLYCTSNMAVTGATIDAPGWTFTTLGFTGSATNTDWVADVSAIAPDTLSTTFTVTWAGTTRCQFMDELGDELRGTIDAHVETLGATGNCAASVTPTAAGVVWAACSGNVSACGSGFTKGADDGNNDWSEYAPAGVAGVPESIEFAQAPVTSWVMTAVTIR